jgi:hypothetical protein
LVFDETDEEVKKDMEYYQQILKDLKTIVLYQKFKDDSDSANAQKLDEKVADPTE